MAFFCVITNVKHTDPFDTLLHRYRGLLYTLCQRNSRRGTTVEDLLQEASVSRSQQLAVSG